MLLCFKVNEHLKDIIEQEQKLREHVPAEAPGGQKVGVSEERRCGRGAAAPGAGRDGTGRGGAAFLQPASGGVIFTLESPAVRTG